MIQFSQNIMSRVLLEDHDLRRRVVDCGMLIRLRLILGILLQGLFEVGNVVVWMVLLVISFLEVIHWILVLVIYLMIGLILIWMNLM